MTEKKRTDGCGCVCGCIPVKKAGDKPVKKEEKSQKSK